jgi:hypothetical protein
MLTEYEVRRRMELIRTSRAAPLRKVRLLLRIGRSLNHQAETISTAKAQAVRSEDRKAMATLARIAQRTEFLHEDVRQAAIEELRPDELVLRSN